MMGDLTWIVVTGTLIHDIDNPKCTAVLIVDWDPGVIGWRCIRRGGLVFLVGPQRSPKSQVSFSDDHHCNADSAQFFQPHRLLQVDFWATIQ
jgi:hypothetical protein